MTADAAVLPRAGTYSHEHVVWPSLGSGLVARIGDWTWQAVARETSCDVLTARTEDGRPAYLSFHYYRIRSGRDFHLRSLQFGDRIAVGTQVLRSGSQSTLTLHRLFRHSADASDGQGPGDSVGIDLGAFWGPPAPHEMRAEQLNRWISHEGTSNGDMVASIPVGFNRDQLAPAPDDAPSRQRVAMARRAGSFREPQLLTDAPGCSFCYQIDAARDLNAAGLLFFASYFEIVDWALAQAWAVWGRSIASFLHRRVYDIELLYQGNADAGDVLDVVVERWREKDSPDEVVDVRLSQAGRVIAIATQRLDAPDAHDSAFIGGNLCSDGGVSGPQLYTEEAQP